MLYNYSPPLLSTINHVPTTSLSLTHAIFESQIQPKPKLLIRKISGEVVKPILKREDSFNSKHGLKSVQFSSKELAKIVRFDKTLCPQSISGKIPLSIKLTNFNSTVDRYHHMVHLEGIELSKDKSRIQGLINVTNITFQKEVIVRYTFDNWTSFSHIDAYHHKSINQDKDQFQFVLTLPKDKLTSEDVNAEYSLKFAIQYNVCNNEYWDNNEGKNYTVTIKPSVYIKEPKPSFGSRYCINDSLKEEVVNQHIKCIPKSSYKQNDFISINETFFTSSNVFNNIQCNNNLLSSSPIHLSCSPVYGMGWAKAGSSWFDSITIDSFSHSPPVSFSS
ncbi:hypothetical protein K502DRAFT_231773 [Neoconidiobolus thromboides FSU 785]|nr:hypothetical protein K502DRAFT_231773 [Neoconidiobolus thromboides FSU 785]